MHYRTYITVRADGPGEACARIRVFMESHRETYEDDEYVSGFWDWFVFGGRWSGVLTIGEDGERPLSLDIGVPDGYFDDVQQLTDTLYDEFIERYDAPRVDRTEATSIWYRGEGTNDPFYMDADGEVPTRAFIGVKYIAVIDYHS